MRIYEGSAEMGVRFLSASKRFWADQSAVITVQMVMLSVLVFGGMGLMMDFGRAYSAHSQMQGYIDQVALAAAQELDGQSDAISRATTAANSVAAGSTFVSGDQDFTIAELVFMSDAPTDSSGNFSTTLAATHATTKSEIATHVLAVATTKSVSVRLLNVGSSKYGGQVSDLTVATSAVATSKRVVCGGLSTLVMCNPFENNATTSWSEQMESTTGYRMRLTADILDGSKPSAYTGSEDRLRLGLLKGPGDLFEFRNLVCSDTTLLPGASTSSKSTEQLRDMCMLATVATGMSCVNDTVSFKGAHPETVTTGLDVVFDMFDGPMAEILDPASDSNFTHNFPTSMGLPAMISRSSVFYPDSAPAHGRMTREDYHIFLDDEQAAVMASPLPFFLKLGRINAINADRAAYPIDASLDQHSRQNHVFALSQRTEWGPAPTVACLDQDSGLPNCTGMHPSIHSALPALAADDSSYVSGLYIPYVNAAYIAANPGSYANWWDVPPGTASFSNLVGTNASYYEFYRNVERVVPGLKNTSATKGHRGRDSSGNPILPPGVGEYGHSIAARNFTSVYGSAAIGTVERRKQRITVVNCEGAESFATATGNSSTSYNDTYVGEVVDVMDVFMVTPPQVKGCSPALSSDPQKNNLCPNENITKVDLDVEMVDLASQNPNEFDARFYAVLVH